MPVPTRGMQAWDEARAELLGFVSRRVESNDAAEDIVQDVLERIHRTDLAASPPSPTCRHGSIGRPATRSSTTTASARPVMTLDDTHAGIDGVVGGADTAEPTAAVQELARCLRPLIDQLPVGYRSAVTLVDLDGLTHNAAARVAGISTSGMKSRVQRGRKKLAALLQDCCAVQTTPTGAIGDYTPHGGHCPC